MLWAVRAIWLSLAVTVSTVVSDATRAWDAGARLTLALVLYGAWVAGLTALLVPRPLSATALRVVAPAAPAAVLGTVFAHGGPAFGVGWWLVLAHSVAACVLALRCEVFDACAQSQAYGTEIRRALRTPPLLCVVLAVAWSLIAAVAVLGPRWIADGRTAAGVVLLVVGVPVSFVLLRSMHSLTNRFCVFVPAGIVVSDPLTLVDPVLLVREKVAAIGPAAPAAAPLSIDTRLGAYVGGLAIALVETGTFTVRAGRAGTQQRDGQAVVFTPLRAEAMLRIARDHRLPVGAQR